MNEVSLHFAYSQICKTKTFQAQGPIALSNLGAVLLQGVIWPSHFSIWLCAMDRRLQRSTFLCRGNTVIKSEHFGDACHLSEQNHSHQKKNSFFFSSSLLKIGWELSIQGVANTPILVSCKMLHLLDKIQVLN